MSSETKSYFCVAEGCNSDERKRGRYGYMKDVRFYPFPTQKKAPALRKRWLDLLRRENYEPKRNHRVCSLHFKEGRPTENHPYPELFAYNNFKESLKVFLVLIAKTSKRWYHDSSINFMDVYRVSCVSRYIV